MSAIAGIFYLDGRALDRPDLGRMLDSLAHRGPDGTGVWIDGSVGLGHQMMWTTPESLHERLPFVDPASGLVVTADARIDNRADLISRLGSAGQPFAEIWDSQLVLRAYEKWGARCVDMLAGDYAFAIWNPREQRLFCARDPLATKHFYYYHRPGEVFAFASEIKALLSLPFVPRELNELQVAYHLLPFCDDKADTLYKDILRCPASHTMLVGRDGVKFEPSWAPNLSRELRLRSDEDYAEAFREVFIEAVRCRLRSAFPVGSMLSGGLDSSSITCAAGTLLAEEGREPLKTFSAVWPSIAARHPKIDERRFMDAVLARGGFDAHFVHVDGVSPLVDWQKIYWHQDHTLSAPNMYMDWMIFKAAHENGVRVLLGGTDGDTVVSYGYQDLAAFARRGRWLKLLREARQLSRRVPGRAHSMKQLVWEHGFRSGAPELLKRLWRALRRRPREPESVLPHHSRARPLNADFVRRISLEKQVAAVYERLFPPNQTPREVHWNDISSGNWAYILESFEKAAAAQHLEVRYPFFDRRLIELCIALPPGQRLQGGYTRSILRRAMHGILPPEVQWRVDKASLAAGVCTNLLKYERETLDDLIFSDPGVIRPYLDVEGLRASYRRYASDPVGSEGEAFTVILAVTLALWLRGSGLALGE